MGVQELLLGRWQDKSIEKVVDFPHAGVYLLKARTFGFKGIIGGTHSWIVRVDGEGNHLVAELTDIQSLKIQGASYYEGVREPAGEDDQLVFISNREGGQKWFGATPTGIYLGDLSEEEFRDFVTHYPLAGNKFDVLNANCNTFSSWICYCLGTEPIMVNIGIGAKSSSRWTKAPK